MKNRECCQCATALWPDHTPVNYHDNRAYRCIVMKGKQTPQNMKTRWASAGLLFAIILMAGIIHFRPQEEIEKPGHNWRKLTSRIRDYQWLDSQHLITIGNSPDMRTVVALDINDQSEKTLVVLPKIAHEGGFDLIGGTDDGKLSTNRRWSIWVDDNAYHVADLWHGKTVTIPTKDNADNYIAGPDSGNLGSQIAWIPNTDRWIVPGESAGNKSYLDIRDAKGLLVSHRLILPQDCWGVVVGITPDAKVVTLCGDNICASGDLKSIPVRMNTYRIVQHPPGTIVDASLSPDGKMIAWQSREPVHERQSSRLRNVLKYFSTPKVQIEKSVWIGDFAGATLKKVDSRTEYGVSSGGLWDGSLRWTPDSKTLSYVWKGDLWAMPVTH